jgi:tetratricopeptide (TPR) repeat protein
MRNCIISFLIFLFSLQVATAATRTEKMVMAKALALYKKGDYPQAIVELSRIQSRDLQAARLYLKGLSHSRLQQFDKASKTFIRALKAKSIERDIYYELGQSQYASNELESARQSFKKSFKKGYKKATSLYYMAYISQILEEYVKAKKYYSQLTKMDNIEKNLKQIAQFQLAEVLTSLNRQKSDKREIVKKYIMPQYKKALNIDETSNLAIDIEKRIKELNIKYRLDPRIMINGRKLPKSPYTLRFFQKFSYDDNVTLETDLPTTTPTQKDSFIFDSFLLLRYQYAWHNRYVVSPELKSGSKFYGDRNNGDIYQNDSFYLAPSLKTRLEHTMFGKMASFLFEIQHNVTNRDRKKIKNRIFYGRSTTYVLGEQFRYFKFGNTAFRFKYKSYQSYDSSLDYGATTFQVNQTIIRSNGHIGMIIFINDLTRMDANSSSDTDSYMFRGDYIIPNYFKGYDLHFGFALTLLDTKMQSVTRGLETTINPSIELSRKINKNLAYSLLWEYTKNNSDEKIYTYEKQALTFQLKLRY